jgi:hypothetical protein
MKGKDKEREDPSPTSQKAPKQKHVNGGKETNYVF